MSAADLLSKPPYVMLKVPGPCWACPDAEHLRMKNLCSAWRITSAPASNVQLGDCCSPADSQCENATGQASGLNQLSNSSGAVANPSFATKLHKRCLDGLRSLHAIEFDKQPFGKVVTNQR